MAYKYMTEKNAETLVGALESVGGFLARVHMVQYFVENLGMIPPEWDERIQELVMSGSKR